MIKIRNLSKLEDANINNEILVVIYTRKDEEITIVTAYKTMKTHKYF